jgi:hypothetical protein
MPASIRARLSYANVMATVALFVALGGSSYAVTSLGKNTVGARALKQGSVGASEVKNGSLGLSELTASARSSLQGARGPQGPQGPQGPRGAAGPAATTLWASLNPDGTLKRGSGVTGVNGAPSLFTRVVFNRDISNCAILSSIGRTGSSLSPGQTIADEFVPNGFATNEVLVATADSAGVGSNRGVHIAVFC